MKLVQTVILLIFSFYSFSALAEEETPDQLEGATKINAEQLFELVEEHDDLVIIDSRKTSDRQGGYIESSVGLQDTDTDEAALASHIASKSTPVIFYCNGPKCGRSYKAGKLAISLGYTSVFWFRGGWEEWTNKGLPVTK